MFRYLPRIFCLAIFATQWGEFPQTQDKGHDWMTYSISTLSRKFSLSDAEIRFFRDPANSIRGQR